MLQVSPSVIQAQPSLQYGRLTPAEREMYGGGISEAQINEFRGDSGPQAAHPVPRTREICGQSCLYDAGIQTLGFKAAYLYKKIHSVQTVANIPSGFCETQNHPPELESHCVARFKAVLTVELIRVRGQITRLMDLKEKLLTYRNPERPQTSEIVRREEVAAPDGHQYAELTPKQSASSISREVEGDQTTVLRPQKAVMVDRVPSKFGRPSGPSRAGAEAGIRDGFSVVERVDLSEASRESTGRILFERDKQGRVVNRPMLDQERQSAYDRAMRLRLQSLGTRGQVPADLTTQRDDEIYSLVVKETVDLQRNEARRKGELPEESHVYFPVGMRAPLGTRPGTRTPSATSNTRHSEGPELDDSIDSMVNEQLRRLE